MAIKCINKYTKYIPLIKEQFTDLSSAITSSMVIIPEFQYQLLKLGKHMYQYEKSITTLNKKVLWLYGISQYLKFD